MSRISVTLQSIVCYGTSQPSDSIFIVYQADGHLPFRYPTNRFENHEMNAKSENTWNLNLPMSFERDLQVTIYEQDAAHVDATSDYLVSVAYTNLQISPSANRTNYNGANYTLNMVVNA